MQMQRSGMSGCCVGAYYYDLGGAHSKYRAKSLEEFAFRVIDIGYNQINTAATNSNQTVERGYLESLGFKEVLKDKNMHLHVISSTELAKALEPFRTKREAWLMEEKRKKREAQLARIEADKKRRADQAALIDKILNELGTYEGNEPVNATTFLAWMQANSDRGPGTYPTVRHNSTIIKRYFGFDKSFPAYDSRWDFNYILATINQRLADRKALAEKKVEEDVSPKPVRKAVKKTTTGAIKKTVRAKKKPVITSSI